MAAKAVNRKLRLGTKARDKVTGYEGVLTARHEYMGGCVRYSLERMDKEEKIEERVFDVERLEAVKAKKANVTPTPTGGPGNEPLRSVPAR